MNYKLKNVAIATFAAVLVVLSMTSGHVAFAYNSKFTEMFSNSGNNQETRQDCGNFCTVTSSNTITSGSSGLTTPSPSPTPTSLLLLGGFDCLGDQVVGLDGSLETNTHSPVAGATITFTGFNRDAGQTIPIHLAFPAFPMDVVTNSDGCYQVQLTSQDSQLLGTSFSNITAHYAGSAAFGASDSNTITPEQLEPGG
jgi:hypothetical protein